MTGDALLIMATSILAFRHGFAGTRRLATAAASIAAAHVR